MGIDAPQLDESRPKKFQMKIHPIGRPRELVSEKPGKKLSDRAKDVG
jgi:hypothetical protein